MEQRLIEVLQGKAANYILPFFWQHGESRELLEEGIGNRVVIQKNAQIVDHDILDALTMKKGLDPDLLEVDQTINI